MSPSHKIVSTLRHPTQLLPLSNSQSNFAHTPLLPRKQNTYLPFIFPRIQKVTGSQDDSGDSIPDPCLCCAQSL
jgi:hypothetical protein